MHNDTLKNLPCFIQTARQGSFSAAARDMNLTPAAVSKNISQLEATLGFRLFNRTTRHLSLTEEGSVLLRQASDSLNTLDSVIEQLKISSVEPSGIVKISVSNVIGKNILLPMLGEFYQQYPHIQLHLDFDDHVVDIVQGGYDLVIRGGHIADSSLIVRPLMDLPVALVASKSYLQRYKEPSSIAELSEHRHIVRRFSDGRIAAWQFRVAEDSLENYVPSNAVLTVSDPEAIMKAIVSGVGIGEVPHYLLTPYLAAGEVKMLLPHYHYAGDYRLVMLYPHRSLLAKRVVLVVEFIIQRVRQV